MTTEDIKNFMAEQIAAMSHQPGRNLFEVSMSNQGEGTVEFRAYNEHIGSHYAGTAEKCLEQFNKSAEKSSESSLKTAAHHRMMAEYYEKRAAQIAAAETPTLI